MANPAEQGRFTGQRVDYYDVGPQIGEGGFGAVYRADLTLHRNEQYVIKFLLEQTTNFQNNPRLRQEAANNIKQFESEAEVLERLTHPHIIQFKRKGVYEYDEKQSPFIVMQYAPGGSLWDVMKREQRMLTTEESFDVTMQLLDALSYAHGKGVLHRDIKPQNLLVMYEQHGWKILLSDFGIWATAHSLKTLTKDISGLQQGIGTPYYMAPEQFAGDARIPSDLYATGVLLYQCMTGELPYQGTNPFAIAVAHTNDPIPDLRDARTRRKLPGSESVDAIAKVVYQAMQKNPDDRYPTAEAMQHEFKDTYITAKEKAKKELHYSIGQQLQIRGVKPETIINPSLSLDDQTDQLQTRLLYLIQQDLAKEQQQNTMLRTENQFLQEQLVQERQEHAEALKAEQEQNQTLSSENIQLQQDLQGVREALHQEQQKNADLQDAIVSKEKVMKKQLDRLQNEKKRQIASLIYLGNKFWAQEKYEETLAAYDLAISLDSNYSEAYPNKGDVLCDLGRFQEALLVYDQIIKFDPNDIKAYNMKGLVLYQLERYEEALAAFKHAQELNPSVASVKKVIEEIEKKIGSEK